MDDDILFGMDMVAIMEATYYVIYPHRQPNRILPGTNIKNLLDAFYWTDYRNIDEDKPIETLLLGRAYKSPTENEHWLVVISLNQADLLPYLNE